MLLRVICDGWKQWWAPHLRRDVEVNGGKAILSMLHETLRLQVQLSSLLGRSDYDNQQKPVPYNIYKQSLCHKRLVSFLVRCEDRN